MPIQIAELEISKPLASLAVAEGCESTRLLVRRHGEPLEWIQVPTEGRSTLSAERLREALIDALGWRLLLDGVGPSIARNDSLSIAGPRGPAHHDPLRGRAPGSWRITPEGPTPLGASTVPLDTGSAPGPRHAISVIVCTRDRSRSLAKCLETLTSLDYSTYEIIVVDNAPSDDATEKVAEGFSVRYVREPMAGLDRARNRGIAEARYPIVAFTDDDVRPDPGWLRAIDSAFSSPGVEIVTGPVAPLEIETWSQFCFEFGYGGFTQSLEPRRVAPGSLGPRELLWASALGVGANMAFCRSLFDAIGSFDLALDAGTPTGTGGDVELLHRALVKRHVLAYEPRALVWHRHRRSVGALRRQLHANGRGFGAYLLTCARNRTLGRGVILQFALTQWLGWWLLPRLLRPGWIPRSLVWAELRGALRSPFDLRRSRAANAEAGR